MFSCFWSDNAATHGHSLMNLDICVLPFGLGSVHVSSKNSFVSIIFAGDAVTLKVLRLMAVLALRWGATWPPIGPPGSISVTCALEADWFLLKINSSDLRLLLAIPNINDGQLDPLSDL